jgi:hypothetical protein
VGLSDDVEDGALGTADAQADTSAALQVFINSDTPAEDVTLDKLQSCFPYRFDKFQARLFPLHRAFSS